MKLTYNDIDITSSVLISSVKHEMFAEGQPDFVKIKFDNVSEWNVWNPQFNDVLEFEHDISKTGRMYISAISSKYGYEITARSTVAAGYIKKNRSWEYVYLSQILNDIASDVGLLPEFIGFEDYFYQYITQQDLSNYEFLQLRLRLEGMSFVVNDGKLIVYSERYLENTAPLKTVTVNDGLEHILKSNPVYGTCHVTSGIYDGTFNIGAGEIYSASILSAGSGAEANRYAKNLLRYVNKKSLTGSIKISYSPDIAPGSIINMEFEKMSIYNGPMFIYRVRNDYEKMTTKLFFRHILEDY